MVTKTRTHRHSWPQRGILCDMPNPFLHHPVDLLAHADEVLPHIPVRKPQDMQPHAFHKRRPLGPAALWAVDLDHQSGFSAIEIGNMVPDGLLPMEPDRIRPEEIVPQVPFLLGQVPFCYVSTCTILAFWQHKKPLNPLLRKSFTRNVVVPVLFFFARLILFDISFPIPCKHIK